MPDPNTPRDLFDRLIRGIGEGRWHDLADLYAEDAVVEQPMAVPHAVHITGREEVRRHFAAASRRTFQIRPGNIVVHDTADPEVIIAEFDYDVLDTATGRQSTMGNVQMIRVRDGLIVASRDYHDHFRFAALAGAADRLAAAMA